MDDRHDRIDALFQRALELPSQERAAFLEEIAHEDPELRRGLDRLLELDDSGEASRVERDLLGSLQARLGSLEPERLGEYTLTRRLGRGGMGVVYEAEQQHPRRTVALKLVRSELVTPGILRRFQLEADVLGRLHHPGIAQIYEAGIAEVPAEPGSGGARTRPQPFFAMELVRGLPITEHAERRALDTRQRLALMARVCEAVHHAHQMGVIHRDLKPANILVDGEGQPKVLDFGVARSTEDAPLATSVETAPGQLIGTLPYMSPEQVGPDPRGVDTRSDVYALGVVLYELLSGRLPLELGGRSIPDAARAILHDEPRKLSSIDTAHRGDVETIVQCALEKDRTRRYASAAELAADLRRFLERQPIGARPATTTYLMRRFAARHPGLVAGAATTALALAAGFVVASVLAVRARSAERGLERELVAVKRLSDLQDLEDLLLEADALWPAWPVRLAALAEWRQRALELVARLPLHRESLAALRAAALPRTEEERLAARERHPEFADRRPLVLHIAARERALRQRRDGIAAELPLLDPADEPPDLESWIRMGWKLNPFAKGESGPEGLALVASLRALELAPVERKAEVGSVVAKAYLALGRDEEALDAAHATLEAAMGTAREAGDAADLERMEADVEHLRGPAGLAEAEAQIEALRVELRALDARLDERREWSFAEGDTESRWWHAQLTKLVAGLEAFADEELGLLGTGVSPQHGWAMDRRRAEAAILEQGVASGGEFALRWEEVAPALERAYPSLALAPQMGLVPIGPDPASGLWEFWHVQSGAEPERDGDGRLLMTEETGIVLVLLHGGSFWMGAQWLPDQPRYEPDAVGNEVPIHRVELSPFFISKFELTQAQWLRTTGRNPSEWQAGARGPGPYTLLHPVEQVSWNQAAAALRRLGLELPSEAQWEYACRAGTEGPHSWPAGVDPARYANVADRAWNEGFQSLIAGEAWDDGAAATAPIGSYLPNAFGLFDMHGNVFECCRDGLDHYFYATSPRRDPVAPTFPGEPRVARGGSFEFTADAARSAARTGMTPDSIHISRGLRAARAVEGAAQ